MCRMNYSLIFGFGRTKKKRLAQRLWQFMALGSPFKISERSVFCIRQRADSRQELNNLNTFDRFKYCFRKRKKLKYKTRVNQQIKSVLFPLIHWPCISMIFIVLNLISQWNYYFVFKLMAGGLNVPSSFKSLRAYYDIFFNYIL